MIDNSPQTILFQENLEHQLGTKLRLKINDNRSTMLSVKWEPDYTQVSLHRIFLGAPQNVMQALACYLKREHKKIAPSIKAYIEHQLQKLDYSHELDFNKLKTKGIVYDLKEIYDQLNAEYFDSSLQLFITWFGKHQVKKGNRVTFGLFHDPLRLIKINRLVDNSHFPPFFVAYIIYHEMLHYACPPFVDEKGQSHIHSKLFKAREKQFKYYMQAKKWVKDNSDYLFTPC